MSEEVSDKAAGGGARTRRVKPIHALAAVLAFSGLVLAAKMVVGGWFSHPGYERVAPGRDGLVRIDLSDLEKMHVRFYRFLNTGNQEVKFLVGRDEHGIVQVGFDANDSHYKLRRGFSYQDGWIIDNKCETTTRLSRVNDESRGCKPVPVPHRVEGDELIITESDMLRGWRYFR